MRILEVNKGFIGIENNKPDAIDKMKAAAKNEPNIEVCGLEVKYPQGAEKMLISALTGREVPPEGIAYGCQSCRAECRDCSCRL